MFIKAIACHLMSPLGEPMEMTAEAELKRQVRLAEEPRAGGFVRGIAKAFGRADIPFVEAWRDVDPFGWERAREFKEAEERHIKTAFARESISHGEAIWLAERIGADGALKDNERALLKYIKDNSPNIDPALAPAFEKAGL